MRVTVPKELTLVSTTAAASTYAEWAVGTAYTEGNYVKVTTAVPHREYKAILAGTGKAPATNPTYWLDLGVTNQYRALDSANTSQTAATTSFEMGVIAAGLSTNLAFINMSGVRTITLTVSTAGVVRFSTTMSLLNARISSWSEFFTVPPQVLQNAAFVLPFSVSAQDTLKLVFTGKTGEQVAVGNIVVGSAKKIGEAQYGVRFGMVDYSRKEADEWGNMVLVRRASSPTWSADVVVPRTLLDYTNTLLTSLRAVPCLYDGNPGESRSLYSSLIIFGFYRQYTITLADFDSVICAIEIEGLI